MSDETEKPETGAGLASVEGALSKICLEGVSAADVPAGANGLIVIDLAQIASNWASLAEHVKPAVCSAVVKADAYGLGADRVIPALHTAGCRVLFVATVDEALQARELTGPNATIFALNGLLPGSGGDMAAANIWPVLSTLWEVEEWGRLAGSRQTPLCCALHVDTGLNRLGLTARELHALAANPHLLDRVDVRLIMSHLACADEPEHLKNAQQRAIFEDLRPILPTAALSLAASDGLMLGADFHYQMVRPGYALYGGQAVQNRPTPVRQAVSAYSRVLQVRDVGPPHTIGYSASYAVPEKTKIATICAGYADGVLRTASAETGDVHGMAHLGGQDVPFVGRVSMDLVTLDVGQMEPLPERGDFVELIGPNLPLERVGSNAGTIGYEILTGLGRRFHRIYLDGGDKTATAGG